MRRYRWFLMSLVLIGLVAAEAAAAQEQPGTTSTTTQRQRAPGVPLAPNANEAQKTMPQGERAGNATERDRLARNRGGPPEPNREVPMPKPVPSIIAP
ncbi:hypothetical protein [Bosea sp. (in: a-proteobacteria)]|uniref:hypothetical protein n=1 Tax=Bosea sp. (in: a-proteobacteria) TaxID=1871050 RepID=UPI002FC8A1FC